MTVSTEVDHNDYTGNGVTTSFPYTFRIFQKTDLMVQVVDLSENITVLTLDTDYSVTGAGTYSGGSVVLSSPLANGWQISISRSLPVTQDTDLRNQGKFFAEVHEDAFDKLTMLIQQCFSFLRLALRKPSFIANYYDALNNRIRNLRDPSQAQDAATKSYVDVSIAGSNSHADNLFKRTIRVPEESVNQVPAVEVRKNSLFGWSNLGEPIPIFDMTETADLAFKLSSSEEGLGDSLVMHVQDDVVTQNLHDFLNAAINEITPEMFGGNLQTAFIFASANKLALNLAAKTYVITEPVTFTGGITVFGKGQHKTKIQQTAGTCGIIQTLSATDDPVVYEGFTLETTQDFDEDNRALVVDGSGLVASSGAQIEDRTRQRGMFRDLRIAGSASSRLEGVGWGVALDLISLGWYETDGLNIRGCSTTDNSYNFQGIGILQRGGGWTVETYHSNARMYFLKYCWYCPDYTEGVFIDKWNLVNVTNAIVGGVTDNKWSADPAGKLGVYQASLSNIHINATTVGIYLVNTNYSDIQNVFTLLDDHGVATANYAVHLRNGKACNASKVNVLHYSTNTGVTRQGIILNAMSDCFISNFQCLAYSTDYEKVTSAFNTVNSSNRNVIDGIKVSNATVAVTNGAGCGNTSIKNYRFSNVTTSVLDNNGDMDRGNIDSRYEAFTLSAAADSYTLTIVPRCYMSRRPTGVSAEITSPTTLAFPIQAFPDYANSTATAVSIIVKPTLSGNQLPATTFGVTIIMKD